MCVSRNNKRKFKYSDRSSIHGKPDIKIKNAVHRICIMKSKSWWNRLANLQISYHKVDVDNMKLTTKTHIVVCVSDPGYLTVYKFTLVVSGPDGV